MKRTILALATLLAALTLQAGERAISFNKLPRKAQTFITDHFGALAISHIVKDKEVTHTDYEVHFTNGTNIDFRGNGTWKHIEVRGEEAVPTVILPESIVNYLAANHSGARVVEVERDRGEYELKISGGVELSFDHNGRFRWYED